MWLLSTDRAELHYFPSPGSVPGGYAILSHVWGDQEMSFQDVQKLRELSSASGFKRPALRFFKASTRSTNPRDYASPKIRESCIIAERHGYKWIWNDTCCIDKSSSSELSEAINSMYQYYSLAEVCYAFLGDVPSDGMSIGDYFAFRNSRWHRRGWTLQELIAPSFLIFLSGDWEILGTKADLADVIQATTGIPASVLRKETDLSSVTVIERMAWASQRETTRVEDEAYCLMGIFAINMTTLYGEGRQAFYRLQEKLMKRSTDTSLFLWGKRDLLPWLLEFGQGLHTDPDHDYDELYHADTSSYLLASSPKDFAGASTFVYAHPTTSSISSPPGPGMIPEFTITPYGVRARLPVVETSMFLVAIPFWLQSTILAPVGLILVPCTTTSHPLRTLYHTGWHNGWAIQRLILFEGFEGDNLLVEPGRPVTAEWREIYIAHRPSPGVATAVPLHTLMSGSVSMPFRFTKSGLMGLLQHEKRPPEQWELESVDNLLAHHRRREGHSSSLPMVLTFKQRQYALDVTDRIVVLFGLCLDSTDGVQSSPPDQFGQHWATVHFYHVGDRPLAPATVQPEHQCPEDHICEWDGWTRTFEDAQAFLDRHSLTLSFSPCPINPMHALIVNMAYKGESKNDEHNLSHNPVSPSPETRRRFLVVFFDRVSASLSTSRISGAITGTRRKQSKSPAVVA